MQSSTSKEVFIERVIVADQVGEIPSSDNEPAIREFVLPKIVSDKEDIEIIKIWLFGLKMKLQPVISPTTAPNKRIQRSAQADFA